MNVENHRASIYSKANFKDLVNAKVAAEYCNLTEERLLDLAKSGYAPCVIIDSEHYYFFKKDLFGWVVKNLVKVQFSKELVFPVAVLDTAHPLVIPKQLMPISDKISEYRLADLPCVYFLIKDGEIVYIGQSISLGDRVSTHKTNKTFDKVFYIQVPRQILNQTESSFIKYFKPKYNCAFSDSEFCETSRDTLKMIGYDFEGSV